MKLQNQKGVTFIEVMMTLAVFSFGIIVIFRAFVVSLDRMSYLTDRLYASIVLDNRVSTIQRKLRVFDALPYEVSQVDDYDIGNKRLNFRQSMDIEAVEDFPDVFQLELSIRWQEKDRNVHLTQAAFITNMQEDSQ